MPLACVLLGDLEGSRRLIERESFRGVLEGACEAVSSAQADDLIAPLRPLRGIDEVGAVLARFAGVHGALQEFRLRIRPQRMRFVLVRGEIDVAFESGNVRRMDGPAFHRAAAVMEVLKAAALPFAMELGDPLVDGAIGRLINAVLLFRETRSQRQQEILDAYARAGSQAKAAETLGITQQAVSEAVIRSGFRPMKAIEEWIPQALRDYEGRLQSENGSQG